MKTIEKDYIIDLLLRELESELMLQESDNINIIEKLKKTYVSFNNSMFSNIEHLENVLALKDLLKNNSLGGQK